MKTVFCSQKTLNKTKKSPDNHTIIVWLPGAFGYLVAVRLLWG